MSAQFVVRPVREEDYDAFLELAVITGGELTNIPGDPDAVRWRVEESARSFDLRAEKAGSHRYLFLLEDVERREVAGTCGIISKVGGFQPFYCYDVRRERFSDEALGIDHEVEVLSPNINYNGPSEICCLYLRPEFRRSGLGKLLSLSRFQFMAEFEKRFDQKVIAELRGVTENRRSPFWEGVARHFFRMEFRRADFLSGLEDKEFIGRLMPKHPLYVPLLPPDAAKAIGRAHRDAEPALKVLLVEGFQFLGQVDIFDAGPIVEAEVTSIRTVRERRKATIDRVEGSLPEAEPYLMSNARLDFRACIGRVMTLEGDRVAIDRDAANLLKLGEGDPVAFSPLRTPDSRGPVSGLETTAPLKGEAR